jgi:hypothetical protein
MVALIGGAMAKTASNSFAEVSGEGVESDGEMGFVIKNVAGDVVITISERDGWKSEKGSPYTYTHKEGDTDNFYFVGREGVTQTALRPAGIGEFDGVKLNVVSDGEFIGKDKPIRVLSVKGNRILVSEIIDKGE